MFSVYSVPQAVVQRKFSRTGQNAHSRWDIGDAKYVK